MRVSGTSGSSLNIDLTEAFVKLFSGPPPAPVKTKGGDTVAISSAARSANQAAAQSSVAGQGSLPAGRAAKLLS